MQATYYCGTSIRILPYDQINPRQPKIIFSFSNKHVGLNLTQNLKSVSKVSIKQKKYKLKYELNYDSGPRPEITL